MFAYTTPGVYFEWQDKTARPPAIQRTDIAGFVGIASRGPLHEAVKVESWTQFVSIFGGHIAQGYLAYAVEGFFANGGMRAWIVRVADPDTAKKASLKLNDDLGVPSVELTAKWAGCWAHQLLVTILRTSLDRFSLLLRHADGGQEIWSDLSMKIDDKRYAEKIVNDEVTGSTWIRLDDVAVEEDRITANVTPHAITDNLKTIHKLYDGEDRESLGFLEKERGCLTQPLTLTIVSTGEELFSLSLRNEDGKEEKWTDLSMRKSNDNYVVNVVNNAASGSSWVKVMDLASKERFPPNVTPRANAENFINGGGELIGGADGLARLTMSHISGEDAPSEKVWGLHCFDDIDEISVVAIPDIMSKLNIEPAYKAISVDCKQLTPVAVPPIPKSGSMEFPPCFNLDEITELQKNLISHCEKLRDRFAILDLPQTELSPQAAMAWRKQFESKYAAIYYSWIKVPDPLALTGITRDIPPSVHIAGVYARGDLNTGVHKPPANQELENVVEAKPSVDDRLHGMFNESSVNAIRSYPGRGIRVSGARTLSTDTTERYINVRRLMMMIIEVIDERAQALVFEPNNTDLWRRVERIIISFLDQIWRAGMLDGATADEAYYVRCDEQTNPIEERDIGRAMALVGVRPPWPAEFVIVRIGFTESGAAVLEVGG